MKAIYYNPNTLQVEAYLDSPNFVPVKNWEDKGFVHALIPEGVTLTRDHKVTLDSRGVVTGSEEHRNRRQPQRTTNDARASGLAKLYAAAGLTQEEIDAQA